MSASVLPSPAARAPEETPLLEVRDLTVRFDAADTVIDVVRGVSFSLCPGRTLCLVGESGSGKSMTALALLGLVPDPGRVAEGSVRLQGKELTALSESAMREVRGAKIGIIFQEPMTSLNPVLRVGDQVAEPLIQHLGLPRKAALARAEELFRLVGIPAPGARLREYPHQLSGGMRQRVMIAMALACEPAVLLADEPTTALDVTIQGQILNLLKELTAKRGMGLVLITHDLGVVAETADEVGVMYAGSLVEQAATSALFSNPLHPYTQGLMRSAPAMERFSACSETKGKPENAATTSPWRDARLDAIPGTVPPPGKLPEGCPFRPRCRDAHERCLTPPPEIVADTGGGTRRVRCWLRVGHS